MRKIARGVIGCALWVSAAACSSGLGPGGAFDGFTDSGGTSIHYVIDLPAGDAPFPAVVYGPGSGDVTVNNRFVESHAKRLIELGYAVVRYDKRGVGQSDGQLLNLSTENSAAVVPQLAADMKAVLRAAQGYEEIDPERMALFGASQGTWYMPLVAAEVPEVRLMIVLTGGLVPVGPQNHWERLIRLDGRDPFSPETLDLWRAYDGPVGFDHRPIVRDLSRPMLYLMGEADTAGPLQPTLDEFAELKSSGVDITLLTFPGGVHVLDGIDFWDDVRDWLNGL